MLIFGFCFVYWFDLGEFTEEHTKKINEMHTAKILIRRQLANYKDAHREQENYKSRVESTSRLSFTDD